MSFKRIAKVCMLYSYVCPHLSEVCVHGAAHGLSCLKGTHITDYDIQGTHITDYDIQGYALPLIIPWPCPL